VQNWLIRHKQMPLSACHAHATTSNHVAEIFKALYVIYLSQRPEHAHSWRMPSSGMWRRVDRVNRRFGGTYRLHLLQPPTQASSSLADFSTLKMEAIRSAETSVHTRSTCCHIPEDGIFQSHRCEILKSYIGIVDMSFLVKGEVPMYDAMKASVGEWRNGSTHP
jgi:hypothetical protein